MICGQKQSQRYAEQRFFAKRTWIEEFPRPFDNMRSRKKSALPFVLFIKTTHVGKSGFFGVRDSCVILMTDIILSNSVNRSGGGLSKTVKYLKNPKEGGRMGEEKNLQNLIFSWCPLIVDVLRIFIFKGYEKVEDFC